MHSQGRTQRNGKRIQLGKRWTARTVVREQLGIYMGMANPRGSCMGIRGYGYGSDFGIPYPYPYPPCGFVSISWVSMKQPTLTRVLEVK
jgi:hypothetical protein